MVADWVIVNGGIPSNCIRIDVSIALALSNQFSTDAVKCFFLFPCINVTHALEFILTFQLLHIVIDNADVSLMHSKGRPEIV